jgi:hypothetical protein
MITKPPGSVAITHTFGTPVVTQNQTPKDPIRDSFGAFIRIAQFSFFNRGTPRLTGKFNCTLCGGLIDILRRTNE